jgi:hypothetical protein
VAQLAVVLELGSQEHLLLELHFDVVKNYSEHLEVVFEDTFHDHLLQARLHLVVKAVFENDSDVPPQLLGVDLNYLSVHVLLQCCLASCLVQADKP